MYGTFFRSILLLSVPMGMSRVRIDMGLHRTRGLSEVSVLLERFFSLPTIRGVNHRLAALPRVASRGCDAVLSRPQRRPGAACYLAEQVGQRQLLSSTANVQ